VVLQWVNKNLSYLIIGIIFVSIIFTNFTHQRWKEEGRVIQHDVKAYYSYLPATLIYGDLSLDFIDKHKGLYEKIWPIKTEGGDRLIITSCGLSMLYSPFFLLAHAYAGISSYEADGYSIPYRFSLVFSTLFYLLLGLCYLRKTLKLFFSEWIVAFVLFAIAIGTNLLYYVTYEAPMPHGYNFGLIAVFVYYTIKWHENPKRIQTIGMGLLFGLIVLVRPTNIVILLFFILWDIKSGPELWQRILFFLRRFDLVLIMAVFSLLVWVPQFMYWKYVTGHWLFFSYGTQGASFFFDNPQIYNILISYKKGWFVYTPIMAIAFIGIFILPKRLKSAFWSVFVYMIVMIYVLSSWWSWWFGGGFGLRAFIDTYAVMAIPLASLLDMSFKKRWCAILSFLIIIMLIWYNTFQTRQYVKSAIHYWWMNKDAYWETFLKDYTTPAYWKMITVPDYELAREGIYEAITPEENNRRKERKKIKDEFEILIYKDSLLYQDIIRKSNEKDGDNKNLLKKYISDNLDDYINNVRQPIIDTLVASTKRNTQAMERINGDAQKRNITIDSMVELKAIYIYRQKLKKP